VVSLSGLRSKTKQFSKSRIYHLLIVSDQSLANDLIFQINVKRAISYEQLKESSHVSCVHLTGVVGDGGR